LACCKGSSLIRGTVQICMPWTCRYNRYVVFLWLFSLVRVTLATRDLHNPESSPAYDSVQILMDKAEIREPGGWIVMEMIYRTTDWLRARDQ